MKRTTGIIIIAAVVAAVLIIGIYSSVYGKRVWTAADFGIEVLVSELDADGDGVDDYADMVAGARAFVDTAPTYISVYYSNGEGYPPVGEGVCTDVIWSAFKSAGYDLRTMLNYDISIAPDAYPDKPDPNIDFRRVKNLRIFFERHAESLTLDPSDIEQWQAGDIVTFSPSHVAVISDKRNSDGEPYIIHHGGRYIYEEDGLRNDEITGHYRWHGWSAY